ncbi:MAG TPA: GNAT family N-acetyltransferase [Macromonas sp.]|nr:GNAT family N-acetyltransferase [Macromonas sp.]
MSYLAAFSQAEWAPICRLDASHRAAIETHLLALDADDRYLRFGHVASDDLVRAYVRGLPFERDEIFGIFNRHLELIGMAHLGREEGAGQADSVEFGVSVSRHARGRGYGNLLFRRAVMHARNEGVSVMHIHALSENKVMLAIARNAGATVERDGADSVAHLKLPPADFESQFTELLEVQQAQANYQLKAQHRQFTRFLQMALAFPPLLEAQEDREAVPSC